MRIVIGSCGGLTGSYLARQFKKLGTVVCGIDTSIPNATSIFLDEEYNIVNSSDSRFIDMLIDLLVSKKIIIISKQQNKITEKWSGFFMVCPYKTFELLNNKIDANNSLKRIGISIPKSIDNLLSDDEYPIFMKPNNGSGSKNSQIITNRKIHEMYINENSDNCFFEYIIGQEYTVDCFFDNEGNLISYNQRIRKKSMGGAVIVTQNDYSFDIYPYLKTISSNFVFKGCVNFQYILKDNIPYFIDVNLRYASGGLPLSVKSGLNVPQFIIDICNNKKIDFFYPKKENDGLTMYRYFEEWYM